MKQKRRILSISARMLFTLICFGFSMNLFAKEVNGKVVDNTGQPVAFANVLIKGTTIGAMTNNDGTFSLNIPDNINNPILEFKFIGYADLEEVVGTRTSVNAVMKAEINELETVVVVGYGTMKKKDVTTAVSSVSAKDFADRPIIATAQALQGKAAGVQVTMPSGKPGEGISVRVRGATSLNAGNDPLYVVDGIPTQDVTNLAPDDIESMQILKDASSAAIYGARAANGVVLITTKRGKTGEASINFSSYLGFSNLARKIESLNTNEYYDLLDEIYGVGFTSRDNQNYTDWNKEVFSTGTQQNYQLSVNGGSDKVKYFVSGGYQKDKGIIKPADYQRFSMRSNLDATIKPWVKLTSNISFARTDKNNAADNVSSARGGVILAIVNTPSFLTVWDPKNPGQYAPNPYQPSWDNPIAQASAYDHDRTYRFMGNLGLDFTIVKDLHFKTNFSADYISNRWDKFIDPVKTNYGRTNNGVAEYRSREYLTWLNENLLTYDKSYDKHNLSFLAGATFQSYYEDEGSMKGSNFPKGLIGMDRMTVKLANNIDDANAFLEEYTLMSGIARVQYNYDSRYLFTANVRADASSKLHKDHRWGYFPSVSAGWRFSAESFFEPLRQIMNDGKLRVAWGLNGNQNGIGNYASLGRYKINRIQSTEKNGPAMSREYMNNRDLTWETTEQYNIGMDLSFFKSRVTFTFDAYYKRTTDLLLEVEFPSSNSLGNLMRNDGEMTNKGLEFAVNSHNLTGNFKWDTDFNISLNRNKLVKLGLTPQYYDAKIESNGQNVMIFREGLSMGSFYGYMSEGVDPETGNMIYKDMDGNGRITPEDRTIIGSAQPDFIFGITNTFSWKNFTLSCFIDGSYGNEIFNASRVDTEGMFDTKNQSTVVLQRWLRPGMITDIPKAGNMYNAWNSTRFVENGSFIRLNALTLSYSFKKAWINKLGMQNLNVYVTGNNLVTLTKYSGYNPEVNMDANSATVMGVDYGTYPQNRSFIFGLNVSF